MEMKTSLTPVSPTQQESYMESLGRMFAMYQTVSSYRALLPAPLRSYATTWSLSLCHMRYWYVLMWMHVFVDDVYHLHVLTIWYCVQGLSHGWYGYCQLLSAMTFLSSIICPHGLLCNIEGLSVYMMSSHVGVMILPCILFLPHARAGVE